MIQTAVHMVISRNASSIGSTVRTRPHSAKRAGDGWKDAFVMTNSRRQLPACRWRLTLGLPGPIVSLSVHIF
jgi:hypothetical protein